MKHLVAAIGMMLVFAACGSEDEATDKANGPKSGSERTTVATEQPLTQEALVGTYVGHLPCETCDGMITSIILHENNTYAIATKPENDTTFSMPLVDSGSFLMRDTILELTDKAGEIRNYKIEHNVLKQLGTDGKPLDAAGESHYQFKKQ